MDTIAMLVMLCLGGILFLSGLIVSVFLQVCIDKGYYIPRTNTNYWYYIIGNIFGIVAVLYLLWFLVLT